MNCVVQTSGYGSPRERLCLVITFNFRSIVSQQRNTLGVFGPPHPPLLLRHIDDNDEQVDDTTTTTPSLKSRLMCTLVYTMTPTPTSLPSLYIKRDFKDGSTL